MYRLTPELAIVQTLDFFPPVVDDPFVYGQIAAANALSDVYAMGGTPITAMNLVGFPDDQLPMEILGRILAGGADRCVAAHCTIVGGHTVRDAEIKFGLSVTGTVHPDKVLTNATAKPGDVLVLTKPLGVGIITTAAKQDADSQGAIAQAIGLMATLNRAAGEAMREVGVHAATDVTGFGLLGHLRNMTKASGCTAAIVADDVPVLEAAWTYVRKGIAPGGTHANRRFLLESIAFDDGVDEAMQLVLCDAQTSGGMLIAVAEDRVDALRSALTAKGAPCATVVGRIEAGKAGTARVTRRR